ncbi:hypothetical protein N0V94_009585 [Neodidymelliopsis sp. IMI 364377]|nr:hypothetical protein N0V94_009585 [Neodidymelliopsis sp. IMI 364377]
MASHHVGVSNMALHLLTLPREVRDNIYKHLHHSVDLVWTWNYTRHSKRDTIARVEKAPVLNVMLTCAQLYEEYGRSSCLSNLHATFEQVIGIPSEEDLVPIQRHSYQAAAKYVRDITFDIKFREPPSVYTKEEIVRVYSKLRRITRHLRTVRLLLRATPYGTLPEAGLQSKTSGRKGLWEQLGRASPTTLDKMQLKQHVSGSRVECDFSSAITSFLFGFTSHNADTPIHGLHVTDAYLYAHDEVPSSLSMGPHVLFSTEAPCEYPKFVLRWFDESKAAEIVARVRQPLSWEEVPVADVHVERQEDGRSKAAVEAEYDTSYDLGSEWETFGV